MKVLHDQGEKQKSEFLHEATMLKGLRHPNVVDYFGLAFSEKDEVCDYFVLDRQGRHCRVTTPVVVEAQQACIFAQIQLAAYRHLRPPSCKGRGQMNSSI